MTDELDAAGIRDPQLRACYLRCKRLLAEHDKSYYLASLLLPPARRPFVHAIYGFARHADEMVDGADAAGFEPWRDRILAELTAGETEDEFGRALLHTIRTWDIPLRHIEDFLAAMASDLTVTSYETYADLEVYMHGAAATLALQLAPVLGARTDEAVEAMRLMGIAFQLTNILRDVGDDLRRGRVYLPGEDLRRFNVTEIEPGRRFRELIKYEIARTRSFYRRARAGMPLLDPVGRPTALAGMRLYGGILDAIERSGYDVIAQRVSVGTARQLAIAVPAYLRSLLARVS
ncbi:phytoene/squalene synthase family protein [Kutzneria sp. CA-103260]|uniref:phytoene/squalene synthase family protein n=1 Tax=Kutzneria sp. CA-103260 TaxID=2802641 RepID=UPI001BAB2E1C|nr:phytoene/squalene synthase family protein [Kutzneria sp. CA-103260]QUQ62432.1 phytoene/squalene synthase family protein [Kutzneria sp. CA-103260]